MTNEIILKKAVIPAGGLGTRLLPVTKELPKEMMPIFIKDKKGRILFKPIMQQIYEELYDYGIRDFCFIVRPGKRAISDYFTSDYQFSDELKTQNKEDLAEILNSFYKKIDNSSICFVNQPKPIGFGDAVYRAKPITGNEPFFLHAGDDFIISKNNRHLEEITKTFSKYNSDATFFVEEVEDPRNYGVITGKEIEKNVILVTDLVEKPLVPPSKLAVIAIYIFKPNIYNALEKVKPDIDGQIQLATALQLMIEDGKELIAIKLQKGEKRIDIGTPQSYLNSLKNIVKIY